MTALNLGILLQLSLKATVLLALAGLLALALRRRSGRLRHLVWSSALVGALLLPAVSLRGPVWHLGLVDAAPKRPAAGVIFETAPASADVERLEAQRPDAPSEEAPSEEASASGARRPPTWSELGWGLWALGGVAVLARLLAGLAHVARMAHASRRLGGGWTPLLRELSDRLGLRRGVRLLENAGISGPMTGGIWRPAIFLPTESAGWSPERRRVVLLHELVHVRRGDAVLQVLVELCCALYWWNPLVWMARRRLYVERELACDETVVALGTRPSVYAAHLLEIASSAAGGRLGAAVPVAALTMIRRSQLEGRLMSILTTPPRRRSTALALLTTLSMASLALFVAVADLRGAPPEPEPSSWHMTWRGDDGQVRFGPDEILIDQRFGDLDFYARQRGEIRFGDDGSIRDLEPGASLVLETSWQGREPRLRVSAAADGAPRYDWSVNGEERAWDDAARRWTAGVLAVFRDVKDTYELRGEVGRLRGEQSRVRGEASRLRGEISRVRGELSRWRGEQSRVRGEESRMRGEISRVRGEVSRLRGEQSRVRGEASRLRGEISRVRGELSALRQLDRLDDLSDEEQARFEQRRADRESRIREIGERLADYDADGRVAEIEKEIEAYGAPARVAEIEQRIAGYDVDGRMAEIEQKISTMDVDGHVAEIEGEIEALDVKGKVAGLEAEIDKVRERLAPYETKWDEHGAELRRLTEDVAR